MPTLYQLKPRFQAMLRPVARGLARLGVTANQVTVATCAVSVALGAGITVTRRGWILLPFFLFLRMALNAVDGLLAREHGQASKLGAALNELSDVLSDAALTLPFVMFQPVLVALAMVMASLTEMAGMTGGGVRRNDGPFGKSDRAVVLGFCGAWLGLGWPVGTEAAWMVPVGWMVLCLITIVNRVRRGL